MKMWSTKEYENYAISVIAIFYPEYKNVIKEECPDFLNDNIGIEITRALTRKDGEMDAFWRKNQNCGFQELSKKQLKKLGFGNLLLPLDSKGVFFSQQSQENGRLIYYKQKSVDDFVLCAFMSKFTNDQYVIDSISKVIVKSIASITEGNGTATLCDAKLINKSEDSTC